MRTSDVEAELSVYRNLLSDFANRLAAGGDRTSLYSQARADHDALVYLIDEVPEEFYEPVLHLIERYEALLLALVS